MCGKFIAYKIAQMLIKLKTCTGENPKTRALFSICKRQEEILEIKKSNLCFNKKEERQGWITVSVIVTVIITVRLT